MENKKLLNWLEIDLTKFISNINDVRGKLKSDVKLMIVLKANAYGHGSVSLAKEAEKFGENIFGVARVEEGIELRKSGIKGDIHLLAGTLTDYIEDIILYNLIPSVSDFKFLRDLNKHAELLNKNIFVHIKVDTGMNRYGIKFEELDAFLLASKDLKNVKIVGVFSHLADPLNKDFTNFQINNFENALKIFYKYEYKNLTKHLLSSDGLINFPDYQYDMVRIGKLLYENKPVLNWKARVLLIKSIKKNEYIGYGCTYKTTKDLKIANISCGYADGLDRKLSNKGEVIIKNHKCKILGRISMDQMVVDVSSIENLKIGEEVIIIGQSQNGEQIITATDIANIADTINYEVWTSISSRVKKIVIYG